MFWLESIHVTFCVQNSMSLKARKLILTLTNLSFTKKVGGLEQKWTAHKFVHFVPQNMSNLEKNAWTEKCPNHPEDLEGLSPVQAPMENSVHLLIL